MPREVELIVQCPKCLTFDSFFFSSRERILNMSGRYYSNGGNIHHKCCDSVCKVFAIPKVTISLVSVGGSSVKDRLYTKGEKRKF